MGRIKDPINLEGATVLDINDQEKLIPKHIERQAELNEWEQANILQAKVWLATQKIELSNFASIYFCKLLHKKMFDKTWRWAGKFRKTNTNIGIDWILIPEALKNLFDDLTYQIKNNSFPIIEIAVRFHHRLVSIHPFLNGNGRHARLSTDLLLKILKSKPFQWGRTELTFHGDTRTRYINALHDADRGDYSALLAFVKNG